MCASSVIHGLDHLRMLTLDLPETNRVVQVGSGGSSRFSFPMHSNDIVLVTLEKIKN